MEEQSATFRFELGDVPVIAMLEKGMPWERIQQVYIDPQLARVREFAPKTTGCGFEFDGSSFLLGVASNLVWGGLLMLLSL